MSTSFAFDMSIPEGKFVTTESEAEYYLDKFLYTHAENDGLGLDTETTGLDIVRDIVVVWSLSDGKERICLPAELLHAPIGPFGKKRNFKEALLENPAISFDFTNAKFDAHMLANSGVEVWRAGPWRDTAVQDWLLNENRFHGLKECTKDYFHRETPSFASIFGKPKKATKKKAAITVGDLVMRAFSGQHAMIEGLPDGTEREIPPREVQLRAADYASLDAYNSTVLRKFLDVQLMGELMFEGKTLYHFFYEREVPFTKLLWFMERRGFTIDSGYLKEKVPAMQAGMDRIKREFARAANQIINLNSVRQLRWFFFEFQRKTPISWTDGGASGIKQPSTESEVLETWAGEGDPFAQLLLEYRDISTTYSTYVENIPQWKDSKGKVHTTLKQTGTVTGRLSSADPNLLALPRPENDDYVIREAFIPDAMMRLVVADYEQLEMRLMAHFSGDLKMIEAILNGIDLHCLTVAEIYGIPYDEVKAAKKAAGLHAEGKLGRELTSREKQLVEYRQAAKATGFGIIYGIAGPGLAAQLTRELKLKNAMSPDEGNRLIRKWLGVFPGVEQFIEETKELLMREGRVQTLLGRYRRFGDLRSMNRADRGRCERQGVNAIIQGSAADVAKSAMLLAEHDPILRALQASLRLQIHDELIWNAPDQDEVIAQVKDRVKLIMPNPFGRPPQFLGPDDPGYVYNLRVPIPVSINDGYSWARAK
jgi:DNA polymerase-1